MLNSGYVAKTLLWFSWLFVGPLLMIGGSVLAIICRRQGVPSFLLLVASIILTGLVGYQEFWLLREAANPLISRPPYALHAIAVSLTVLADVAAVHLYRQGIRGVLASGSK